MHSIFMFDLEFRSVDSAGRYYVAYNGLILHNYKLYTPSNRRDGYQYIPHKGLLHRLVAMCWIPNPDNAKHVHHKDRNKTNNCADNLEWVTPKTHMAERHFGEVGIQPCSPAAREKLRQYRLGSKTSEETKQKQREASIRLGCKPPVIYGRIKSEGEIEKMRQANNTACEIDGVWYESMKVAAKTRGEGAGTLRKRCLSKNFPTYKRLISS